MCDKISVLNEVRSHSDNLNPEKAVENGTFSLDTGWMVTRDSGLDRQDSRVPASNAFNWMKTNRVGGQYP